jgi:hypothetical protein
VQKDVENGWIRIDKICTRLKDNKHGVTKTTINVFSIAIYL